MPYLGDPNPLILEMLQDDTNGSVGCYGILLGMPQDDANGSVGFYGPKYLIPWEVW